MWLSDALLGGALLFGLAWLSPADWKRRLVLALVAGLIVAAFHALMWPHCLQRLEGVSPEVERLWLSHVREARPVYRHGWQTATIILALPASGAIGWLLLIWRSRIDREKFRRTLAAAAPGFAATALLFWQTRTGPAAQMLAVPGAVALVWILVPYFWSSKYAVVRVLGVTTAVLIGLGAAVPLVVDYVPTTKKKTPGEAAVDKANRLCNTLWGYHDVALQPRGMVFTFVDLAPRLITVTHHNSIAGPYHRNGQQIADVMNAFRGSADQAHAADRQISLGLSADMPEQLDLDHLHGGDPEGLLRPAPARPGAQVAGAGAAAPKSPFRMWRVTG